MRILISLFGLVLLTACAAQNPARVDYCLAALAGLEAGDEKLLIEAISGKGETVDASYRRDGELSDHRILCRYSGSATSVDQLNLEAVTLDGEELGPGRLTFLKSHWLDTDSQLFAKSRIVRTGQGYFTVGPELGVYLQSALSALPIASVYVLLALGFALIHGLTGRMNIAHGEFATTGAYAGYIGFIALGSTATSLGIAGAIAVTLIASGCAGWLTIRSVFLPLAQRQGQMLLVASAGVIIIYEEAIRISHAARELWLPPVLADPIALSGPPYVVTVTPMELAIAAFAAATTVAVLAAMTLSRFGHAWRAVSDDMLAAQFMGLDPARVITVAAVLSSSLAGLAGLIIMLGYGNANHSWGLILTIKAMVAALIGGMGSLTGAVLGALVLVTIETCWVVIFGGTYKDAAVFAMLIGLLTLAPDGLFGLARKTGPAK